MGCGASSPQSDAVGECPVLVVMESPETPSTAPTGGRRLANNINHPEKPTAVNPLIRLRVPSPSVDQGDASVTSSQMPNCKRPGDLMVVDAEDESSASPGPGRPSAFGFPTNISSSPPPSVLQGGLEDTMLRASLQRKRSSIRTSNLLVPTARMDDLDAASEARTPRHNLTSPRPSSLHTTPMVFPTFVDNFEKEEDEVLTEFVSLQPPPENTSSWTGSSCIFCKADLMPRAKFCHDCGKRVQATSIVSAKCFLEDANHCSWSMLSSGDINTSTVQEPNTPRKVYHRQVKVAHRETAVLGRGAKGCIYKAIDVVTGKPLAVKEMTLDFTDPVEVANIRAELRHLSALRHPNVVEYLGCMVEEGKVSILMERLECGSLADLLQHFQGGLPEEAVRTLTAQLLQAVAYCHNMNTTHRDIKPANILQNASGVVKLSDFGSAIVASNVDHVHVAGTPAYMPPEVCDMMKSRSNSHEYGMAHDIWSVGCTVHELLTGKKPWAALGLEPLPLLFKMKDLEFSIDDSISLVAKNFISRCLEKNMRSRATAQELLAHQFVQMEE